MRKLKTQTGRVEMEKINLGEQNEYLPPYHESDEAIELTSVSSRDSSDGRVLIPRASLSTLELQIGSTMSVVSSNRDRTDDGGVPQWLRTPREPRRPDADG